MSGLRVFWLLMLLPAFLAGPPARAQTPSDNNPSVFVENQSGRTVLVLRASLSTQDSWGEDRLGDTVLRAGQRFALVLPRGACIYDLRAEYEGGGIEEKTRLNLCRVASVSFDGSGARTAGAAGSGRAGSGAGAETGNPSILLVNRSGRVVREAYASLSTDTGWGSDRLGQSVLAAGRSFTLSLPNGPCRWDLRVVYEDQREEEKRNLNLCQVSEVAFDGRTSGAGQPERAPPPAAAAPAPRERATSFGTGFFISPQGHMLTNHHVIDGCRQVRVMLEGGPAPATVLRHNQRNDLALLRVERAQGVPYARFRAQPSIRPGDGVVVAGFPLPSVLQNGLNITTGTVSAMAGLGGDIALMQITAPVQSGNSGGPLLDLGGHVVGVIVSKLNAQRIAAQTGDLPQNVNFAVQGAVARLFLESGGTRYTEAPSQTEMRAADVGDRAREFTFQIECR
jgi:S1-C subfamily serine protease